MTLLHSEPSSGGGTGTLCLTARAYTPDKLPTPTATLSGVAAKLSALSMQTHGNGHVLVDEEHQHELEELDVEAELRADGEHPFRIDRRLVKEVVQEKLGVRIERVRFLSAGTFHKAFLLYLDPRDVKHAADKAAIPHTVVFRIARRTMHMPRLKTESEVATLAYLRTRTAVPVPTVYWYDASPYNALGGEWMVMSKAPGVPLSKFYHTLPQATLRALLRNLAALLIPLFAHRFPAIGSLYFADPTSSPFPPGAVPLTPHPSLHTAPEPHVTPGPIISYPFFGSSRGLLLHTTKPPEIDRGPWPTFPAYLAACVQREIAGVVREGQGREVGHRPRVAPTSEEGSGSGSGSEGEGEDEWGVDWTGGKSKSRASSFGPSSFGSAGKAPAKVGFAGVGVGVGGAGFGPLDYDLDTDSDTETASSGTGDGDAHYRDYRATQRSTFLVAHTARREACVREEMGVFLEVMAALREEAEGGLGLGEFGERGKRRGAVGEDTGGEEAFALDCHDLSLENVFVDEGDHSKITCIIDWESTCIRPLFQAAHLPTFLQPHHGHGHHHGHHHSHAHHHRSHAQTPHRPHLSRTHSSHHAHSAHHTPLPRYLTSRAPAAQLFRDEVARLGTAAGAQWLALEQAGAKRRWAHRVVEWDGWAEGLAGEILGELEYGWEVEVGGGVGVHGIGGHGIDINVEGPDVPRRRGHGHGHARGRDRDVSVDGGRELGRRLEQWVREGATVASYHDGEDGG